MIVVRGSLSQWEYLKGRKKKQISKKGGGRVRKKRENLEKRGWSWEEGGGGTTGTQDTVRRDGVWGKYDAEKAVPEKKTDRDWGKDFGVVQKSAMWTCQDLGREQKKTRFRSQEKRVQNNNVGTKKHRKEMGGWGGKSLWGGREGRRGKKGLELDKKKKDGRDAKF